MNKFGGNLPDIAEHVRSHGRGGDDVLVHVNPDEFAQMRRRWGEPSVNPHTGLPEYGLFSKLKKALGFEAFNVKGIIKDIAKNPQRLLVGAVDPLGTKLADTVLGTKWQPVVNQLGGATDQRFRDARAAGLDTGMAQTLHGIAGTVAGFYGGNALGNLASEGLGNIAQGIGDANTLSPVVTTATSTDGSIAPAVVTAGQTSGPTGLAGNLFNLAKTGQTDFADLGEKALNYAKNPKNWGTIAKLAGGLGALGSAGAQPPPAPQDGSSGPTELIDPNFGKRRFMPIADMTHYGEGPEHQYYEDVPGAATGGYFSYGPMPPELDTSGGDQEAQPLAQGGPPSVSPLGVELSQQPRYMQEGPGSGRADQIDAKLSPKEYVMDAETVALLGDGNPDHGAKKLDEMRRNIRAHKGKNLAKGKFSHKAKNPEGYL